MDALSYRLSPRDTLSAVLRHYQQRQGCLPSSITVGKGRASEILAELRRLGCAQVTVEEAGGCLANEVWLWLSEEGASS
jgi:hypothetical protein